MRCTLTVMDSNSRIDSDGTAKTFQPDIATNLESLSLLIKESLDLVAVYLVSPFTDNGSYQGDLHLQADMRDCLAKTKEGIQQLVNCVIRQVQLSNTVQVHKRMVPGSAAAENIPSPSSVEYPVSPDDSAETSHLNLFRERNIGHDVKTKHIRDRLGAETIECWHRIYPMRTFCTNAVQCAVQSCTLLVDVIAFIDFISNSSAIQDLESAPDKLVDIEMQCSSSGSSALGLELTRRRSLGSYSLLHKPEAISTLTDESCHQDEPITNDSQCNSLEGRTSVLEDRINVTFQSTEIHLQASEHDDTETLEAIDTSNSWSQYSQNLDSTVS
jgi:hypothetical protein